jgi:tetratricopeptide (TPR) repeat protein
MARVVEHDPLNAMWQSLLGAHLLDAGRIDEALEAARTGVSLDVNHFVALNILGNILWVSGDREAAFEMFDRAHRLAPWDPMGTGWYAAGLWHRGQKDEARQLIRAITPSSSHLWGRVIFHLEAGELEEAADWYERMIAARDPFALVYARATVTKSLREHPRWRGLAELMHLPPAGAVDV